ncbi:MAG: protein kinase [Deltaproteobacteria bacterium]|nr:protein kinase [Deltaproteobacteria bacterium]
MSQGGPYRTGQHFGPYTLEAYLGTGAFKSVYKGRHPGQHTSAEYVALGFPHQQDAEGLAELEKEFAVSARLVHPNIVQLYAIERYDGVSFLVMEYLEGESLRAKLRTLGALPPAEAVRYAGLVAEALTFAHAAHVLHRDVKPENIFLAPGNVPKLLDFGIARVLARTSEKASTLIGTIEYMAPELLQGAAGTNADLWALGITLYEMLTGSRPFTGDVGEVVNKVLSGRYTEAPLREHAVDNRVIRILRKMLSKDPETRYRTADEVVRDLETAARRARLADDDESRLEILIRASYPLVCVFSFEEERVLAAVRAIAARLSEDRGKRRAVYVWSASQGLRDETSTLATPNSVEDPTAALVHAIENPEDAIYVFLDLHHHFTPVTTRLVRDAARAVRMTRKSVLFLSPFFQVPEELQKEVTLTVFQLPDRAVLEPLVQRLADELKAEGVPVDLGLEDVAALVRAAAGLTVNEAERALRRAAIEAGGLSVQAGRIVIEEKTQLIRKSGILEYYHTSESFAEVGGLDNLLAWFAARAPVFAGISRYAGLPQPKGVLLVGVPGCGKSLSARALAGAWRVPLLRLDVGRIFGSLVGASEANLRRAIHIAEAVSPCILWIDELEKGFAGVGGQGGGGVTDRVFGTFLQWLQDKQSPVFVVATANDLTSMPPEFLRQGRFDEKFFVGLPENDTRETILRIHLAKRRRDPARFDLKSLVAASARFSGAELEQAVISGLFHAFDANREVETADIHAAIQETFPLAKARAPEIIALEQWAVTGAKPASTTSR